MRIKMVLMAALVNAGAVAISSCSMKAENGKALAVYQAYDRPAALPQNLLAVQVKVSLSKQRVYVIEEGKILMVMPVSVGEPDSPTPTGTFRISKKEQKHRSSAHGFVYNGKQIRRCGAQNKHSGWSFKGTPMPYWCEFKPGLGFHTGWVRHSPCTSDGCVRMHENLAPKFFRMVSVGTPVNISYTQSEDARWAHIPLHPDAGPLPDHPFSMYLGDAYFTHHKTPEFD